VYHKVREFVAQNSMEIHFVRSIADFLTTAWQDTTSGVSEASILLVYKIGRATIEMFVRGHVCYTYNGKFNRPVKFVCVTTRRDRVTSSGAWKDEYGLI